MFLITFVHLVLNISFTRQLWLIQFHDHSCARKAIYLAIEERELNLLLYPQNHCLIPLMNSFGIPILSHPLAQKSLLSHFLLISFIHASHYLAFIHLICLFKR